MQHTTVLARRAAIRGAILGAAGLSAAALLGCGGAGTKSSTPDASTGRVVGASSGGGLPMNAPKVTGKVRPGGTWTDSGTSTYKQHDPHTALGPNIWHVISEKPLEPHPVTGEILPHVLTKWEIADPSGMTLVFKVRNDLKIQNVAPWNGRLFDAEDVAFNMMRIGGLFAEREKQPLSAYQRASMVANIVKAEAVDPTTVKVTLSKPNSAFFNGLTENRVPMHPKEMADIGFNDPMKMASFGPYQISEWVNDVRMVYKKYPGYFRPNEPYMDTYKSIVVPDLASQQAAFISGQTQFLSVPKPDQLSAVRAAKPDANLYTSVDTNWGHIRVGMQYAPFRDFRVRKALSLAIDYEAVGNAAFGDGWGYQLVLSPGFPEAWKPDKVKALAGFNPATKAQDRSEAQKLMAAAGYANGKGLEFLMISNGTDENPVRFQGQMSTVLPEMKITLKNFPDLASFSTPQAEGKFDILSYGITGTPDAAIEAFSNYHSKGSRNYGRFVNTDLDALLDKALVELNREARSAQLDEFQRRYHQEWMPNFILYANARKVSVQKDVGGYDTLMGPWFGYSTTSKICRLFYVDPA